MLHDIMIAEIGVIKAQIEYCCHTVEKTFLALAIDQV